MSRLWVIAYDIEDDAVRRRVHDILQNHGQRVQYSVFECWLTNPELDSLHAAVRTEIGDCDQVRWYPPCHACQQAVEWQGVGGRCEEQGYYLP
jgi:CRISPR-associated protein Cas2